MSPAELLDALEKLIENYKYNGEKGLGVGPLAKANLAIAKAKGRRT